MIKHLALITLIIGGLLSCSGGQRDFRQIHKSALVADMHCDGVLKIKKGRDYSVRNSEGHMDIPRLKEGGTDLQVFACWVDTETPPESCQIVVDELIDSLESMIDRNASDIALCTTAGEAEKIIAEGKVAAFLGIENGVAIAEDPLLLEHYYDRGVRYMTLTHTASSDWCISSADTTPAFGGLTDLGIDVVWKMNELGMIIDISHASVSAVEKVLKYSKAPVIASHSCVHAICPHDRNLTDDQIEAIATRGGVIGINYYNGYISKPWERRADSLWNSREGDYRAIKEQYKDDDSARDAALQPIRDWFRKEIAAVVVDVGSVVDHIDYIVKLVGADYVGLGSDWDGVGYMPEGLDDCSMVPNITKELVGRGYSDEDIGKILGGNFMRVFRQVCGGEPIERTEEDETY
jgi:membrane dipeptidase